MDFIFGCDAKRTLVSCFVGRLKQRCVPFLLSNTRQARLSRKTKIAAAAFFAQTRQSSGFCINPGFSFFRNFSRLLHHLRSTCHCKRTESCPCGLNSSDRKSVV